MRLTYLFKEFFQSEKIGGVILVISTIVSLVISNSPLHELYTGFWHVAIGDFSVEHLINDGFMAIFFLLVGLELKREFYVGELSSLKTATLPMFAALGGMLVPAAIYLFFNNGLPSQSGAGIPMATDIAFSLGVLSLLGKRVPASLKIFLAALAVVDDLGAIIVIALSYSKGISWDNLAIAFLIFGILLLFNKKKVNKLLPYLVGGIFMWYFILHSGIHATITGVLLAFTIPLGNDNRHSAASRLQHFLHKPVSFVILPLFALANTAIIIGDGWFSGLLQPASLGIFFGLVLGKPLGIMLFSLAVVSLGLCRLPVDMKWKHIVGLGILAGIGFTMSIFITLLAFEDAAIINVSKLTILFSSTIAGVVGFWWLKTVLKEKISDTGLNIVE